MTDPYDPNRVPPSPHGAGHGVDPRQDYGRGETGGFGSGGAGPYQYGQPLPPYGQAPQAGQQYGGGFGQQYGGGLGQPPAGFIPQADSGFVAIPGLGNVRVAGFGQRFLARLIDAVIYAVVYAVCFGVAFAAVFSSAPTCTTDPNTYETSCTGGNSAGYVALFGIMLLAGLFGLLYEWLMIGLVGATLGKMALRLKVVDQATGRPIGLGRAFIRQLIPYLGSFFCGVGQLLVFLSPLMDNSGRMQGWHDKAANDLVIQTS
ncbi:RDD family protein [Tsukamurella sp. 8F]|uniref:RDD family protein n=1 Tax=unclassified Tsukamurella TaxID=2633480 RepID=UPI0023B8F2A4|nr:MULTISPECIES: RDD family protein [unclassified Tsukamurella]MDF0529104.1 RDD family protein [Tsukamurella sp. 8J]MDF0588146.1 RDD family protein [Tsukamurella sp. 8F]